MGFKVAIGLSAVGLAGLAAFGARALPMAAQTDAAATASALEALRPGLWSIQAEEPGGVVRRICLHDMARLAQPHHADTACSHMLIASAPHEATIHYSCPGNGWGRTALRIDSATSVRIDTQGIADNAPFAYRAVARREGDCRAGLR